MIEEYVSLFDWLIDWLRASSIDWLIGWSIDCLIGWSIDCLIDWLPTKVDTFFVEAFSGWLCGCLFLYIGILFIRRPDLFLTLNAPRNAGSASRLAAWRCTAKWSTLPWSYLYSLAMIVSPAFFLHTGTYSVDKFVLSWYFRRSAEHQRFVVHRKGSAASFSACCCFRSTRCLFLTCNFFSMPTDGVVKNAVHYSTYTNRDTDRCALRRSKKSRIFLFVFSYAVWSEHCKHASPGSVSCHFEIIHSHYMLFFSSGSGHFTSFRHSTKEGPDSSLA